jgi:chemotaxis protein MotB
LNARLATLAEELNIAASENEQLSLRVAGLETENAALADANDSLTAQVASLREGLAAAEDALLARRIFERGGPGDHRASEQSDGGAARRSWRALMKRLTRQKRAKRSWRPKWSIWAAASMRRWPARWRAWRAIAPNFSASSWRFWAIAPASAWWATALSLRRMCLFASGSADLSPQGQQALTPIADAILQLINEIPSDLDWVLRVDGHTDRVPPGPNAPFESNWELSTARSLSVIAYFESRGVPPRRLLAAGFGEHYPINEARTAEAYAQNRRIELKLTSR